MSYIWRTLRFSRAESTVGLGLVLRDSRPAQEILGGFAPPLEGFKEGDPILMALLQDPIGPLARQSLVRRGTQSCPILFILVLDEMVDGSVVMYLPS